MAEQSIPLMSRRKDNLSFKMASFSEPHHSYAVSFTNIRLFSAKTVFDLSTLSMCLKLSDPFQYYFSTTIYMSFINIFANIFSL